MADAVDAITEVLEDGRLSIEANADTRAYWITEG
jgi:hypothetical protein